jgi:hypothetical protein
MLLLIFLLSSPRLGEAEGEERSDERNAGDLQCGKDRFY